MTALSDPELRAMQKIARAIAEVEGDSDQLDRVLRWVYERWIKDTGVVGND